MTRKLDKVNCTDIEWIGRAKCDQCHIRHVMLFSNLPDSAFDNSLKPINNYLYPTNSVLYETNVGNEFVYSIRGGLVKLVHTTQDGSDRIVRLLGPGTAVGLELLDGANSYHHTAIAVSEVDLCKIPVSTIKHLESKYPELIRQVGQRLQNQLNVADQWIVALSTGTAKQRVAQLLLMMNDYYSDSHGCFILLHRDDMAAMTGITIETVSRIIADFKRQNILYKSEDKLYKCEVPALQDISQQD